MSPSLGPEPDKTSPDALLVTHGIPPFPDHCYLEIPENVVKFNKNHSTIFVRIIEIFLFKSILVMDDEKIGPYSLKTPTLKEERDVTTKN